MTPWFVVSLAAMDGRVATIRVSGDVTRANARSFERQLLESVHGVRADILVVDLTDARLAASESLNRLVRCLERIVSDARRAVVATDDVRVASLLEVSRLDRLVHTRSTHDAALAAAHDDARRR